MLRFHTLGFCLCAASLGAFAGQTPAPPAPPPPSPSPQTVTIQIDGNQHLGRLRPVWNYFGYDEPNYTYMSNGRKLLAELAELTRDTVQIRTHNLLTTGDGVPALKWGSTNAYTEDTAGRPVYNWSIVDKILDAYLHAGVKPFIELGFMPKALSTHPIPYQHDFPIGDVFTGWAYPPTSYDKWGELVFQLTRHCVQKYGQAEALSWAWEVWNEPDIGYWHGTAEEYNKLYDVSVAAVRRALPGAKVGGPATTGPSSRKAAAFLKQFLEHCIAVNAPLDFITFHVKGRPEFLDGHVVMGLSHELADAEQGFQIVRSFDKLKTLPIILSEADPEGCAACSDQTNPANAYRNGELYPAYTAVAMKALLQLADRDQVNLQGVLTWAFEFEGQPYFEAFRSLATNGVDKAILNYFRMAGLMTGDLVQTKSSDDVPLDTLLEGGVRQRTDVDALAVRGDRRIAVMAWHYRDGQIPTPAANVALSVSGLPANSSQVLVSHYRIDRTHSNAFTVWNAMGSPQQPTREQLDTLERASQLQMLESPRWMPVNSGTLEMHFSLPIEGLSLVEVFW